MKCRAFPRLAVIENRAAVGRNDLPNDDQPQAGTFFFGREKRRKHIGVGRDSTARVADLDQDRIVGTTDGN